MKKILIAVLLFIAINTQAQVVLTPNRINLNTFSPDREILTMLRPPAGKVLDLSKALLTDKVSVNTFVPDKTGMTVSGSHVSSVSRNMIEFEPDGILRFFLKDFNVGWYAIEVNIETGCQQEFGVAFSAEQYTTQAVMPKNNKLVFMVEVTKSNSSNQVVITFNKKSTCKFKYTTAQISRVKF